MQVLHHGSSRYRPGSCVGRTLLPTFDLLVVTEGRIVFDLPVTGLSLAAGDAAIVPPRTQFSGQIDGDTFLWVHHFDPGADELLQWLHKLPPGQFAHYPGTVGENWPQALLRRIGEIHFQPESDKREQTLLLGLLLEYIRRVPPAQIPSVIDTVIHEAREQHWRKVDIGWMALRAGLSQSHFRARFLKEKGQSVGNFLKKKRMERAVEMLRHTDIPIKEISAEIGYSEVSAFHHAFRSTFNYAPTEFRRRYPKIV